MNKAIITGCLTRDPEKRTTPNGVSVSTFTIAVKRRFKNVDSGYDADFINCVAWRATADFVAKYFQKGSRIGVVGSIQTRSYDDKNGNKRYVTEVVADEVEFAGGKEKRETKEERPQAYNDLFDDEMGIFEPLFGDGEVPF